MKIRRPRLDKETFKILDCCNNENIFIDLKILPKFFINSNFIVKTHKVKHNYYFYVFVKDLGCICHCEFIDQSHISSIFKLKEFKNVFTPHCDTHPKFRNIGLVSNIYKFFLMRHPDAVLATYCHTKIAKTLWESVANKIKGELFYHNIITGKRETKPTTSNVKILKPVKN